MSAYVKKIFWSLFGVITIGAVLLLFNFDNAIVKAEESSVVQNNGIGFTADKTKLISKQKVVLDFDENEYNLTEYVGGGYCIKSKKGIMIEGSNSAQSPYLLYNINLYYGGPGFYFTKDENSNLINIITNERYTNFVWDKKSKLGEAVNEAETQLMFRATPPAFSDFHEVANADYFRNLKSFGRNTEGTCAYLAMAINISYFDYRFPTSKFMDQTYRYSNNQLSDGLHQYLLALDGWPKHKINSVDNMKSLMKDYLAIRKVSDVKHQSLLGLFATNGTLIKYISDNKPIMVCANMTDIGDNVGRMDHSFVMYATFKQGNERYYEAHMGWSGYESTFIWNNASNILMGGVYCIEIN